MGRDLTMGSLDSLITCSFDPSYSAALVDIAGDMDADAPCPLQGDVNQYGYTVMHCGCDVRTGCTIGSNQYMTSWSEKEYEPPKTRAESAKLTARTKQRPLTIRCKTTPDLGFRGTTSSDKVFFFRHYDDSRKYIQQYRQSHSSTKNLYTASPPDGDLQPNPYSSKPGLCRELLQRLYLLQEAKTRSARVTALEGATDSLAAYHSQDSLLDPFKDGGSADSSRQSSVKSPTRSGVNVNLTPVRGDARKSGVKTSISAQHQKELADQLARRRTEPSFSVTPGRTPRGQSGVSVSRLAGQKPGTLCRGTSRTTATVPLSYHHNQAGLRLPFGMMATAGGVSVNGTSRCMTTPRTPQILRTDAAK